MQGNIRYILEEGERMNRRPKLSPLLVVGFLLRGLFMTKEQRAAARRFMGFALMEPILRAKKERAEEADVRAPRFALRFRRPTPVT